jgi:hypothetical protein
VSSAVSFRVRTYTVPSPNTAPIIPMYLGRSMGDVKKERSIMTPRYIPAQPRPTSVRPMMSAFMEGAAPHTADPTSNRATQKT